jgi:hypothetical protein
LVKVVFDGFDHCKVTFFLFPCLFKQLHSLLESSH